MPTSTISTNVVISSAVPNVTSFVVVSGGTLNVVDGAVMSAPVAAGAAGVNDVGSDGDALITTINSGGREYVAYGGSAYGTQVNAGGRSMCCRAASTTQRLSSVARKL